MHGIILFELARFSEERIGHDAWRDVLRAHGLETEAFTPLRPEPDERVIAVLSSVARKQGVSRGEIERRFGRWLAPHLVATYAPLIPSGWGVVEILLNVEDVIHRAVRLRDATATPPQLHASQRDDGTIVIEYASHRRLCQFAVGLVQGIALSYGRIAAVRQPTCMNEGDARCDLHVRLA